MKSQKKGIADLNQEGNFKISQRPISSFPFLLYLKYLLIKY
jgi:hypothetical protein